MLPCLKRHRNYMLSRLWYRSWKILAVAALIIATYIYFFVGLRFEVDGSGVRPLISLYDSETHITALEQNRVDQLVFIDPDQTAINWHPRLKENVGEATAETPDPTDVTKPTLTQASPSRTPIKTDETVADNSPLDQHENHSYWTDFRGPNRDGLYAGDIILTNWPTDGLRLRWRQPIGGGYASFVVADGNAFTIEQRRHLEVVTSYDLTTGHEIWTHMWNAYFKEGMGGDGPRATPTWDDGRLYALGATGEFRCLDAETGQLIWKRNILTDNQATNLTWAMSASPLVVDDKVIVLPGGKQGKSVVAYHKLTGEIIWTSLSDGQGYTAPMSVTLAGRSQILVVSAQRAVGLAVEDGSLLWDYPWRVRTVPNIAQPVILDKNRVFVSAGYGHGSAVFEITSSTNGYRAQTLWQNKRMRNKFSSSVLHDGYIYGLDESILACVDAETGQRKWKGGRYGHGQLLLASEHLIILSESGDVVLIKATPERHEELARFSAISGKTWNVPVIADGCLLVRNTTQMACYNISVH